MNKKEFAIFASALRTYYPKENILPNGQAIELWFKQLQDIPYQVAEIILNKWVAINKWSPSIADIRAQAVNVTQGEPKSWGEAWDEVRRAIHEYGSYQEEKALESFDELTRRAVRSVGFQTICMSENIANERASFRMIYESLQEKRAQEAQLPPKLKALMSQLPMLLGEGEKHEE